MLRSLSLAFIFLSCASAAGIWPERLGSHERKAAQGLPLAVVGANEYAQEASEVIDGKPLLADGLGRAHGVL